MPFADVGRRCRANVGTGAPFVRVWPDLGFEPDTAGDDELLPLFERGDGGTKVLGCCSCALDACGEAGMLVLGVCRSEKVLELTRGDEGGTLPVCALMGACAPFARVGVFEDVLLTLACGVLRLIFGIWYDCDPGRDMPVCVCVCVLFLFVVSVVFDVTVILVGTCLCVYVFVCLRVCGI